MDWLSIMFAFVIALTFAIALIHLMTWIHGFAGGKGATARDLDKRLDRIGDMTERTERAVRDEHQNMRKESADRGRDLRKEVSEHIMKFGGSQGEFAERLREEVRKTIVSFGETLKGDVKTLAEANAKNQEALRQTVTERLDTMRADNEQKLESMRATVEEKLQGTLEKRLGESFALVSDRLEMVHKGLGEMQTLAIGVGDLKRVMSNVKDRGGWAEVQLGAMLEQVMARDQYVTNAKVEIGATEMVEFAVRMPGGSDSADVLLPIDAKFPKEAYERLMAAWDAGDSEAARAASDELAGVIENEAKRISSKYIRPPATTDFAVMYLPTEGLFAEAMRVAGLVARLQSKYRVTVAGPTTLHALLNSLQMGFRTLAIQKRSSEVWRVLGEAKTEFQRYAEVWDKLDKQLQSAQKTIHEVGTRTRAVERKLRQVEVSDLPSGAQPTLDLVPPEEPEEPVPLRRLQ